MSIIIHTSSNVILPIKIKIRPLKAKTPCPTQWTYLYLSLLWSQHTHHFTAFIALLLLLLFLLQQEEDHVVIWLYCCTSVHWPRAQGQLVGGGGGGSPFRTFIWFADSSACRLLSLLSSSSRPVKVLSVAINCAEQCLQYCICSGLTIDLNASLYLSTERIWVFPYWPTPGLLGAAHSNAGFFSPSHRTTPYWAGSAHLRCRRRVTIFFFLLAWEQRTRECVWRRRRVNFAAK